jgi:hypothetical protein
MTAQASAYYFFRVSDMRVIVWQSPLRRTQLLLNSANGGSIVTQALRLSGTCYNHLGETKLAASRLILIPRLRCPQVLVKYATAVAAAAATAAAVGVRWSHGASTKDSAH